MTTLLVASSGGHLAELHHMRPRLEGIVTDDVLWVTFDTPQSRSLLAGEDVLFVDHTGSRDYRHVMTNSVQAARILRSRQISAVVSTGAAIALSFLPLARTLGIPAYYVESAARRHGPSTTGRLLARVPGLSLYTQHASWADGRWNYAGCVFDGYEARERRFPARAIRRAVVTLGTQPGYGFRRQREPMPPRYRPKKSSGGAVLTLRITKYRGQSCSARCPRPRQARSRNSNCATAPRKLLRDGAAELRSRGRGGAGDRRIERDRPPPRRGPRRCGRQGGARRAPSGST